MILEITFNGFQERIREVAVFGKVFAFLEIDDGNLRRNSGSLGLLFESDQGIMSFG